MSAMSIKEKSTISNMLLLYLRMKIFIRRGGNLDGEAPIVIGK
jgi:hypothetical protein